MIILLIYKCCFLKKSRHYCCPFLLPLSLYTNLSSYCHFLFYRRRILIFSILIRFFLIVNSRIPDYLFVISIYFWTFMFPTSNQERLPYTQPLLCTYGLWSRLFCVSCFFSTCLQLKLKHQQRQTEHL